MGTEVRAGSCSVSVVAAGAGWGSLLRDCSPILEAAPGPPSGLLNSSCVVKDFSSALKAATYLDSNNDFFNN